MRVWIGTSGYSYPDWVGPFYPAYLRANQMLGYYCRHFPIVELNFTFYRPPTAAMLARIAAQTPAGFRFLIKIPRALSHEADPTELAGFRLAVEELRQQDRLSGLLCQLPQASHHTREHLAWLETLAAGLAECRLAVEFRHRSWFRPEIADWLRDRGMSLVAVDAPNLPNLYPSGLVQAGSPIYVRFHSRNADNWYRSDKERYDYDYRDDELGEWVEALRGASGGAQEALLLFNNCQRGQAAANAERMRELLHRLAPELDVVEGFGSSASGSTQGRLFD